VIQVERAPSGPTRRVSIGSERDVAALRRQFAERHHVVIRGLFGPALLAWIQEQLEHAPFKPRTGEEIAGELTLQTGTLVTRMLFAMNDPAMHRAVEAVTDVGPLARYDGRIYRKLALPEHFCQWHDDVHGASRLVAMSVNLGSEPYDGGVTEIRYKGSTELIGEVHNTGPGDALIFRVAPELQHRVTGLTSGVKTAMAGWFGSSPAWPEVLANGSERH
jgi:hypothetical protein